MHSIYLRKPVTRPRILRPPNFYTVAGNNVEVGDTLLLDCENNYVRSDGLLVIGIGLENLIIIATENAVLVLPKDRGQDVKNIVAELKTAKRTELL